MRLNRFIFLLPFFMVCITFSLKAQSYVPVFPDLTGQLLLDSLVWKYKPITVLNYGTARDTMYGRIYNVHDSVYCVYSGYRLYLPPGTDPTEALYLSGSQDGINNEHTWPQSFGAEFGNPQSDMHHMFPSRAAVNDARGNLPFAEIPDSQTDNWYYLNQSQTNIPGAATINLYSEKTSDNFEPREDHKGNVARAMFYFYTMYRTEADNANPDYFWEQRATLCNWHYLDPVDQLEYDRTWMIAHYQNGRPNPYVLDCSLVARAWCDDLPGDCAELPLATNSVNLENKFTIYPNPNRGDANLKFSIDKNMEIEISIFDESGALVQQLPAKEFNAGTNEIRMEFPHSGMYIVRINTLEGTTFYKKVISF